MNKIKYKSSFFVNPLVLDRFLNNAPKGFEIVGFAAESGYPETEYSEKGLGGIWIIIKYIETNE